MKEGREAGKGTSRDTDSCIWDLPGSQGGGPITVRGAWEGPGRGSGGT